MAYYDSGTMQQKIDASLRRAALVLSSNREAVLRPADGVQHQYNDKYLLADHLTNTAQVCYLSSFEEIGLSRAKVAVLKGWSSRRSVSLRFERKQRCQFVREIEKDVEDPTRVQVDSVGGLMRSTVKVITKVKEYVYTVEENYQLVALSGVGDNPQEKTIITERTCRREVTTRSSSAPFREASNWDASVNITWLMQHLDAEASNATFRIDRANPACATPRRNPDVEIALQIAAELRGFCDTVRTHLCELYAVHTTYGNPHACKFDLQQVNTAQVFSPVMPLFDERADPGIPQEGAVTAMEEEGADPGGEGAVVGGAEAPHTEVTLPRVVVNQLLQEHRRSLAAACAGLDALFEPLPGAASIPAPAGPQGPAFFTAAEAKLLLVVTGLRELTVDYALGMDFIEQMIRSQLVAAIGKEVTMRDFSQYMIFHNRKVFREEFVPRPFSHAVRRSAVHSPEGQVQIVTAGGFDGSGNLIPQEPIYTVSQRRERAPYMEFALNATSTVRFGGERHLHGWMAHRFSGQALPQLKLVAQARQFSGFIVLIGRIASAKVFQPKYGFIAQNKDEFSIPLELEQIPTAKEFKDAISSLSPEQQRFAKAYRSMQLESTLFAVCVVQIKPQLEKVLKLQADSLTKEIKLTQDLMQLFIKYQIPSDLLSYQEQQSNATSGPGAGREERLLAVKRHVEGMQEMLAAAREEEVAAAREQRRYEGRESSRDSTSESHSCEDDDDGCNDIDYCEEEGGIDAYGSAPEVQYSASPAKRSTFTSRVSKMVRRLSGSAPPAVGGKNSALARDMRTRDADKCADMEMVQESCAPMRKMKESSASAPMKKMKMVVKSESAPAPHSARHQQAPQTAEQPAQQPQEQKPEPSPERADDAGAEEHWEEEQRQELVDYTKYPNRLEEMCAKYDPDSCLRPTIINPGSSWTKNAQAGLLGKPTSSTLLSEEQNKEKEAAFDLLDALTRSGALPIEHASLHVVIAATHCFDQSVMDTLVQKNVNPIERVERSMLVMASALNELPALALVQEGQVERVSALSPLLLDQMQEQHLLEGHA
jgi:hypothetical protein